MKKAIKIILICILVILLLAIGAYALMANYYADGFSYGTYINGVYCTGKSVDQVNAELSGTREQMPIKVSIHDRTYEIKPSDIDYRYDYGQPLADFLASQNSYMWGMNISNAVNHVVEPVTTYDPDKVRAIVEAWNLGSIGAPHNVYMYLTENEGYVLRDGKAKEIDSDKVFKAITEALDNDAFVDVTDEEGRGLHTLCIDSDAMLNVPEYTDEELGRLDLYTKIKEFEDKRIIFTLNDGSVKKLGPTEVIGLVSKDVSGLPYLDDKGQIAIDEKSVGDGISKVLEPYNTYQNHYFKTHNGDTVHVTKGTYGSEVIIDEHILPLYEALSRGDESYIKRLDYKRRATVSGPDDIGDTYLEISIDEQHLYYFEGGELKLDSDIVTGNHSHGSDTPKGVYDVFYMQRNRTLVGANYRSFVKYWINFAHHIGVHDASWRDEYGGDIYLHSGSHGCVNTPEEKVAELYDMIKLGTPVIVY